MDATLLSKTRILILAPHQSKQQHVHLASSQKVIHVSPLATLLITTSNPLSAYSLLINSPLLSLLASFDPTPLALCLLLVPTRRLLSFIGRLVPTNAIVDRLLLFFLLDAARSFPGASCFITLALCLSLTLIMNLILMIC